MQDSEDAKPRRAMDIVDFIISIIEEFRSELAKGTISSLAIATFFRAISSEKEDLKVLEANALDNLSIILSDIKFKLTELLTRT